MHTPGTWKVWTRDDYLKHYGDDGEPRHPYYIISVEDDPDGPWHIADITGGLGEQVKANAILIALSPDLLAFAEAVDRNYRSNISIDFSYWSGEDAQLHEEAKALIAKAKGE